MIINNQPLSDFAIGKDEHDELLDGDLSEVCELHSRGFLVEIISVSVNTQYTDSGAFDGIVMIAGEIDGDTYHRDDLHNVTCIGGGFTRIGDTKYFAIAHGDDMKRTRDEAIAVAAQLVMQSERTPVGV